MSVPVAWPASRCFSPDLAENCPCRYGSPDFGFQPSDRARFVRIEGLFHFHGLEHDDEFAGLHGLSLFHGDLHDGALHGSGQRVPGCPTTEAFLARLAGRCPPAEAGAAEPTDSAAGRVTSMRLPATSTVTAWRSPFGLGVHAGVVRGNRVVELGFDPSGVNVEVFLGIQWCEGWVTDNDPVEGDCRGDALDLELGQCTPRAFECLLTGRAGDDQFCQQESKFPPITSPVVKPPSSRTPGPDGGFHTVSTPGAGRKLRPGSSPLIRNSNEWPRRIGSS